MFCMLSLMFLVVAALNHEIKIHDTQRIIAVFYQIKLSN